MARNPEAVAAALGRLVEPQVRGRLVARGLARGMIWRDGVVPDDGPTFAASLTSDLLDFGYSVLALALELRDANREQGPGRPFATDEAFRTAAEAIESAVRRGSPTHPDQGRHLVMCAAAFHLAGYAARSFSLLPVPALDKNLASAERALALLLRRDLLRLRSHITEWLAAPAHSDETLARRLLDENDDFGPEDAAVIALGASYHRALGFADSALLLGEMSMYDAGVHALESVVTLAAGIGNVPMWWVATLTLHLVRDIWSQSLHVRLPPGPGSGLPARWDELRRDMISLLGARHPSQIDLWPSQLKAAERAADATDDLVVALPTSAGKTRIAELCILRALADSKRIVYVTPLRALSAQVERVLARTFVPLGATVTSLYGASGATFIDTNTLANADIVVSTPEKLDFALRQDPTVLDDVSLVVLDEGHMIGVGSREIRYEVLIQRLLRRADGATRRIVCLSAMFNPTDVFFQDFSNWLKGDDPREAIHVQWRPTRQRLATLDWNANAGAARLSFTEDQKPFVQRFLEGQPARGHRKYAFPKNEIEFCISAANAFARDGHSILVYSPQRNQVEPLVREFCRVHDQGYLEGLRAPAPKDIEVAVAIGREWLGADHPAVRGLESGVGTHHGALPRPFLSAMESLINRRLLPIVVASPTLAQGIDLACSVLIFRSLQRFNAEAKKQVPISPAEFANVLGRAGRAYVDLDGIAVFPTYEASSRTYKHQIFDDLVKRSRGQQLVSGLAKLIWEIGARLKDKLGVSSDDFLEYVLNQQELWSDARLAGHAPDSEEDDGEAERTLDEFLADLDVALLSLVDPLDASIEELGTMLDEMLRDSLWKRTLARISEAQQKIERALLVSRAGWLWRVTTTEQRRACFSAGLGQRAGTFLYEHRDELVGALVDLHAAIVRADGPAVGAGAVAFAARVMHDPFFAPRNPPDNWQAVLVKWVEGVAFADILKGLGTQVAQSILAFVHDDVIFKLVWAAEAVRAQAVATEHARSGELGDGPAFALTYGVPSIAAGLLCQTGFDSRVGATWVTRQLFAYFDDLDGMRAWLAEYEETLSDPKFWESDEHYHLWVNSSRHAGGSYPKVWKREEFAVAVRWLAEAPPEGTRVRLIARGKSADLYALDLTPLGTALLPHFADGASLDGVVTDAGGVRVRYFGPH